MIYTLPNIDGSYLYSTPSINEAAYKANPSEVSGLFGDLYITDSLPLRWSLIAHKLGSPQDLADYLLANRLHVDSQIAEAINTYFWDF